MGIRCPCNRSVKSNVLRGFMMPQWELNPPSLPLERKIKIEAPLFTNTCMHCRSESSVRKKLGTFYQSCFRGRHYLYFSEN